MIEKSKLYILFQILLAQLNERELPSDIRNQLYPELLLVLYRISYRHDLAHIIGKGLLENGVELPEELHGQFKKADTLAVYRCAQQKEALVEIGDCFETAGISYVPLKGAVLRTFYPHEAMRTSCDVDVLVKQEDLERAYETLAREGYRVKELNYHDVSLISPTNVHLELHFSVRENMPKLDGVLNRAWDFAVQEEGYRYAFSKEFFVFQIFAHMAYHFVNGGCGIKALLDIWVMEHKMGYSYLDAQELLEEGEIFTFASKMTDLTRTCFGGAPEDEYTKSLLQYIVTGGNYGTAKNKIASKKSVKSGMVGYIFRRLFLPYENMKHIYPVIERWPILLPFFWMVRLFSRLITGRGGRAVAEIKTVQSVDVAQTKEIQTLRKYLGI